MHNREKKKIRLCELSGGPDHKISPQRPLTLNQIPATSAAHSWKPDSKKSQQEFRKTFGSRPSLQPLLPTFPLNAKQGFPPPLPTPHPPREGRNPEVCACMPVTPPVILRLSAGSFNPGKNQKKKGGKDGGADGQEVGLPPLPVNLPDASEERRRRSAVDQASLSSLVVGQLFFFIWSCSIYIDMLCFVLMHKHKNS